MNDTEQTLSIIKPDAVEKIWKMKLKIFLLIRALR